MDFIKQSIDNLYNEAKSKGLSMKDACKIAGIHPTTPSRWRAGISPRMKEFLELHTAISEYKVNRKKEKP